MSSRTLEIRDRQGDAAIYTEAEAVVRIPRRDEVVRAWLRETGLVRDHPVLGRIVLWAEVLEHLRAGEGPVEPEARPASGYPRAGLRRR